MSTSAPITSSALSPTSGSSTRPASAAPTMDPKVFTPYTVPIARSPPPALMSVRVMSGSVIPAQKVAGSITSSAMPYRATVNAE
jgi:hypothetical protein